MLFAFIVSSILNPWSRNMYGITCPLYHTWLIDREPCYQIVLGIRQECLCDQALLCRLHHCKWIIALAALVVQKLSKGLACFHNLLVSYAGISKWKFQREPRWGSDNKAWESLAQSKKRPRGEYHHKWLAVTGIDVDVLCMFVVCDLSLELALPQ